MKATFAQKPVSFFNKEPFVLFEQKILSAKNYFSPNAWVLGILPALYGPGAAEYLFKEFFSTTDLMEKSNLLSFLESKQQSDVLEKKFIPPLNKLTFLNSLDLVDAQAKNFSFTNQDHQALVFSSIQQAKAVVFDISQAGII